MYGRRPHVGEESFREDCPGRSDAHWLSGFKSRRTGGGKEGGPEESTAPRAGLSAAEVHSLGGDTRSVPAVAAHGE